MTEAEATFHHVVTGIQSLGTVLVLITYSLCRRLWYNPRQIVWVALILTGLLYVLLQYVQRNVADLWLTISCFLITAERHSSVTNYHWHRKHITTQNVIRTFISFLTSYAIFAAILYTLNLTIFDGLQSVWDKIKSMGIAVIFILNFLVFATHVNILRQVLSFRQLHPHLTAPLAIRFQYHLSRMIPPVTIHPHCQDASDWLLQRRNQRNWNASFHLSLALIPSALFTAFVQLVDILISLIGYQEEQIMEHSEIFTILGCVSSLFPLYHCFVYFLLDSAFRAAFTNRFLTGLFSPDGPSHI